MEQIWFELFKVIRRKKKPIFISKFVGAGDARTRTGLTVHVYVCNSNMIDKAFYNR